MCGGGGSSIQLPQDNSLQVEMQRQQAAQQETQRQNELKAQQRSQFETSFNQAHGQGVATGRSTLQQMGVDPGNDASDPMHQLILSITNNIRDQIPDLDANPASYYTPEAYTAGINKQQDLQRQGQSRRVGQFFTPGFEENLLPDNSVDSIIDSILGGQQTTARQSIDANQKRGTLNDVGYQNALSDLDRQSKAGRSTLAGIGNSVLGKERGELSAIRGQAGDVASNYMLGDTQPDFGSFFSRAQGEAGRDLQGLEGSILASLGGTSLFDVPTALAKGGTMQGGINLTTQSGLAPFSDEKRKSTGRGLGSTGTF